MDLRAARRARSANARTKLAPHVPSLSNSVETFLDVTARGGVIGVFWLDRSRLQPNPTAEIRVEEKVVLLVLLSTLVRHQPPTLAAEIAAPRTYQMIALWCSGSRW